MVINLVVTCANPQQVKMLSYNHLDDGKQSTQVFATLRLPVGHKRVINNVPLEIKEA